MSFLSNVFTGKVHKELNQVNELATQQGHRCQSSSQASYCPNIFSRDENNVLEHRPGGECSRLVKMLIGETPSELACFGSFLRSNFRFQKNKGQEPCVLKFRTIQLRLGYG